MKIEIEGVPAGRHGYLSRAHSGAKDQIAERLAEELNLEPSEATYLTTKAAIQVDEEGVATLVPDGGDDETLAALADRLELRRRRASSAAGGEPTGTTARSSSLRPLDALDVARLSEMGVSPTNPDARLIAHNPERLRELGWEGDPGERASPNAKLHAARARETALSQLKRELRGDAGDPARRDGGGAAYLDDQDLTPGQKLALARDTDRRARGDVVDPAPSEESGLNYRQIDSAALSPSDRLRAARFGSRA